MKKVGLLTCYMDNFGACLQAYALQHKINECGYSSEIIRYTPIRAVQKHSFIINLAIRLNNFRLQLFDRNMYYYNRRLSCFRAFRRDYLHFSKEYYNTEESLMSNPPDYDRFVVGSDQLWNPLIHGNKNNKAYFLRFEKDPVKKIAYAPSIGISQFPDELKDELAAFVSDFSFLSVREASGKKIINEISNKKCDVVIDPTLLLKKDEWEQLASKSRLTIEKPYIFCYLFSDQEIITQYVEYAKQALDCEVYIIPFTKTQTESPYNKLADIGPVEFVSLIKNAALVITDSFHATAFSTNLNTPFYSFYRNSAKDRNNMNSRITDFLSMVHLEDRIISEGISGKDCRNKPDFAVSNAELEKRREIDYKKLKNALAGEGSIV